VRKKVKQKHRASIDDWLACIESLHSSHAAFLKDLSGSLHLGDLFTKHLPFFLHFRTFLSGYDRALDVFAGKKFSDVGWKKLSEGVDSNPLCGPADVHRAFRVCSMCSRGSPEARPAAQRVLSGPTA
jgi:hypothetical protein